MVLQNNQEIFTQIYHHCDAWKTSTRVLKGEKEYYHAEILPSDTSDRGSVVLINKIFFENDCRHVNITYARYSRSSYICWSADTNGACCRRTFQDGPRYTSISVVGASLYVWCARLQYITSTLRCRSSLFTFTNKFRWRSENPIKLRPQFKNKLLNL